LAQACTVSEANVDTGNVGGTEMPRRSAQATATSITPVFRRGDERWAR
jgi:hypothetical protein